MHQGKSETTMDADERLTALKKAYADIILNTAKEAAARIMVSERKALRYHYELNATKEQGLQMLLRLKQMMDSKVSEAEVTSLSQQRKIKELKEQLLEAEDTICKAETTSSNQQRKMEELEAQLQEAEDIVKDLREELREVQTELERVKNKKLQHLDKCDNYVQAETSQVNGINTSQPAIFSSLEMKNSTFTWGNEIYKSCTGYDHHFTNSYAGKPDLPSISEENKLTSSQYILPSRAEPPEASCAASGMKPSFSQRNEVLKGCDANNNHARNSYVSKSNLPAIILRSKEPEPYRNRRTQRIRAFEEKLMAGELCFHDPVNDINEEISHREDEEGEGISGTATHKANHKGSMEKKGLLPVKSSCRKRKRATKYKKTKTSSLRYLPNQATRENQTSNVLDTEANCINNDLQSGEGPRKVGPKLSSDTAESRKLIGCSEVTECDAEVVKTSSFKYTLNSIEAAIDKLLPTREVNGFADSVCVSACEVNLKETDKPVGNLESKSLDTITIDHPVANRMIKYTFQRKRKKESLNSSSDRNASLEMGVVKKAADEKQNDPVEVQKSSLITESSRDSRRIAQVARQLISLSEKRWWQ